MEDGKVPTSAKHVDDIALHMPRAAVVGRFDVTGPRIVAACSECLTDHAATLTAHKHVGMKLGGEFGFVAHDHILVLLICACPEKFVDERGAGEYKGGVMETNTETTAYVYDYATGDLIGTAMVDMGKYLANNPSPEGVVGASEVLSSADIERLGIDDDLSVYLLA